jgi:hypothetical protein
MNIPTVHPFLLSLITPERSELLTSPAAADPAWNRILQDVSLHGLAPLLHQWSRKPDTTALPSHVQTQLAVEVADLVAWNLILTEELAAILKTCRERSLTCAPLRGLSLAHYLSDAPSVRPMGDLDLLVKRDDCAGVRDALQRLGYTEVDRRPGFAEAYSYTLEFVKDRHGWITVEPHWTVVYPPFMDAIDMDAVWNRCRRGTIAGVETWLLSREDLLINLCWHLNHKDADAPFLWWHELDRLLRQGAAAVDWPLLLSTIGRGRHARLFADVLATLVREFHSPIPAQAIAELGKSASIPTPHSARLFTGPLTVDGIESLAQFCAIKGLRAKAVYACALLIPSREFMMMHYAPASPSQLYLQYARRVLSCAWESLKGLVNLFVPARRPSLP